MKKKYLQLSMLTILSVFFLGTGLLYRPTVKYPFKCYGFTEYNLMLNNEPVQLNLSQDIRLFDDKTGEISFSGEAVHANKSMILHRKVKLTDASRLDNDTLTFTIHRTEKSLLDNTHEDIYNLLMNEYSASQTSLQIDLDEVDPKLWLISSPTSFITICHEY
ncbi:FidL-like protein [Enterobacter hormaechei]